jgi:hypothetical protein
MIQEVIINLIIGSADHRVIVCSSDHLVVDRDGVARSPRVTRQ